MYSDNDVEIVSIESLPEQYADSSTIKLSEDKKHEIGSRLVSRLEDLKAQRRNSQFDLNKKRDFNSYHMQPPEKPLPYVGYPNLACPMPRIGIDTFHANVLYTFGGQNGKFSVLPDFLSRANVAGADRAAKYMSYVLNYESGLFTALDKADMDAEIYGNGYLEARYCKEYVWETRYVTSETTVPDINELTGEVTPKKVTKRKKERVKVCKFDGIKVDCVPFESVYMTAYIEELEDAIRQDYVFKVKSYSMRYVEENAISNDKSLPPFFDPAAAKKIKDFHTNVIVSQLEREKQKYDGFMVELKVQQTAIELAEAHFWEDVNGDGLSEKITVIFETGSGTILRATYGECRMVMLTPRPVRGRSQGESVRRATQPLIVEWEAIHNARVAKGQWANLPIFFFKAGGRFNPQAITLTPGKGYPLDDPNSVTFPQLPAVDVSYFNEERMVLDYFERVLALGESMQGIIAKNSTATETINAQQRAGIRLSTPINRIATALDRLLGHMWDLNRQCAPELKEFMIAGVGDGVPMFESMTSKDYAMNYSFKLFTATMFDTQTVRDTALLNYKTFISNPLVLNNPASFYELTKNTMKAVGLEINIPKPDQARAQSPFVKMDLCRAGKPVEPILGEDPDEHLAAYDAMIRSEEFKDWPVNAQKALIMLRDKMQIQQTMLHMGNLNKSGVFEGMTPNPGNAPAMDATRNPSATMNRLRVGENQASQQQNVANGAQPQ